MFCMFGRKVEKLGRLPLHNLPPALNLTSANAFEIRHCSFESVCVCVVYPPICVCVLHKDATVKPPLGRPPSL